MIMEFTKMHGIGNDFVMVDGTTQPRPDDATVAQICDRHFGVGADGLIVVTPTPDGVEMDYRNADGSHSEMCGNGLRCTAWFGHTHGWAGHELLVTTARGPLRAEVPAMDRVRVEVGPVTVLGSEADGMTRVDVGNPHAVFEVDDVAGADVPGIGGRLDRSIPGGVNTGFFRRTPTGIELRVNERGVGETLACGSGAVAAARVALGGDGEVAVSLPGGTISVEVIEGVGWITGPVAEVFKGTWH